MTRTASRVRVVTSIPEISALVSEAKSGGRRVAFVPTMGALHEGHLSLVARGREVADVVVMSVFVNPLQFGAGEDFSGYPRELDKDVAMAGESGVDVVFAPPAEEMYPEPVSIGVSAGARGEMWEGEIRPRHFDGVLTVVAKLLNIVRPDSAIFGQKDLQQLALVRTMVRDLDFPVEILSVPIVRDPDGLALSSRNIYLNAPQRSSALALSKALKKIGRAYSDGELRAAVLEDMGHSVLDAEGVAPDYLAIVDTDTLQRVKSAVSGTAVLVAARIGTTRLIDNLILS